MSTQIIFRICSELLIVIPESAQSLPSVCPEPAQSLTRACPGLSQSLPRVCPEYAFGVSSWDFHNDIITDTYCALFKNNSKWMKNAFLTLLCNNFTKALNQSLIKTLCFFRICLPKWEEGLTWKFQASFPLHKSNCQSPIPIEWNLKWGYAYWIDSPFEPCLFPLITCCFCTIEPASKEESGYVNLESHYNWQLYLQPFILAPTDPKNEYPYLGINAVFE